VSPSELRYIASGTINAAATLAFGPGVLIPEKAGTPYDASLPDHQH
jgi:hypothetical protein